MKNTKKDILWYILIGLVVILSFCSIILMGFVGHILALIIGMIGWLFCIGLSMFLLINMLKLKYCRTSLTRALNTGGELVRALEEQQFINQQLYSDRAYLINVIKNQIATGPKKKIKN